MEEKKMEPNPRLYDEILTPIRGIAHIQCDLRTDNPSEVGE